MSGAPRAAMPGSCTPLRTKRLQGACRASRRLIVRWHTSKYPFESGKGSPMRTSRLVAAVVLVITLGSAIGGFVRNTEMPEQPTVTEMFDQTSQIGNQSELA